MQLLVNTANLNLYVRVVDLAFGGPPPALALEQSYNADDRRSGPLGTGWTFNLGDTLTADVDSSWVLRRGSGRIDRFGPAIDPAQFFAITPTNDVLTRAADGSFTLRSAQTGTLRGFNKDGRLVSIQSGGTTRVALDYNAAGRLTAARPGGGTLRPIQFAYGADGRIASITDTAGRTVSFGYDAQGNLVQQTNAGGGTISYAYDDTGRLAAVNTAAGQTVIAYSAGDSSGVASITLADGSGRQYAPLGARQVQVTDGAANVSVYASTVPGQTQTFTDASGNVTAYTYDGAGRRTSTINGNGSVTRFEYDGAGNLTAVTDAAQNRWTASYNGALLSQLTDAGKNSWQFSYDSAGRLNQVTDPYGLTASVTRNAAGLITAAVDPNGNQSSFQYDVDGLPTRFTDGLSGSWSYQYDGALRTSARTEPGGAAVQAAYDAQNRLAAVSAGQANLALNAAGVERDSLSRVAATTDSFGNHLSFTYDAAGRLASLTLPPGSISYQYDLAGRLAKVSDWLGDFAIYKYDAAGLVTGVSISAGPVTAYQYDTAGNLRALIGAGTDGAVIAGYRYTLDPNGNRVGSSAAEPSTAGLPLASSVMTYDSANRIRTATGGRSYRYDGGGRLIGIDGPGAAAFTYDAFGRLTAAGAVQYGYDTLGLRVERNAGGAARRFVYDLSGPRPRVAMETDGSNNPVAYYVWGLGPLWKIAAGGQIYFYHFDGDGNVVALSTSAGIANRYRYDALGRLVASDESVENSFRARGEAGWVDDGNGLLYSGADYYAPDLRLRLPGTVNLDPPNPALAPRFPGPGACFFEGVADCAAGAGGRAR